MYRIDLADLPKDFNYFVFSGGEPHLSIPTIEGDVYIEAIINDWNEFGKLLLLLNCLNNQTSVTSVHLYVPYFPGARQDRNPGGNTPLTVAVYANAIADNLTRHIEETYLYMFDIHSSAALKIVGDALSPFHGGREPMNIEVDRLNKYEFDSDIDLIIAPDHGAVGRATCFRDTHFPGVPVVYAEKTRNFDTGNITGYSLPELPMFFKALVVDDICDGGRTFNELAKAWWDEVIRQRDAGRPILGHQPTIQLYVSHGIFSRGVSNIDSLYSKIYTTRSHARTVVPDDYNASRLVMVTLPEPEFANV